MGIKRAPTYFEHVAGAPEFDVLEWPAVAVGERPITQEEWNDINLKVALVKPEDKTP